MKNIFYKGLIIFFLINANLFAKDLTKKETEILKNLRCLICQGQSVAESNSEFALTVKSVVNDKLKDGLSEKEVYEFLADKYGDWILYNPPLKEESYLLWLFPYVFFIIGAIVIFFLIKKSLKHKQ